MSNKPKDQREFTRVGCGVSVSIQTSDGVAFSGPARDVSVRGAFVVGECPIPLGSECSVEISLVGGPSVSAAGRIARVEDDKGFAIELIEVSLEAYDHLRKLVLYNAEDPERVESEFSSHLGLKQRT